MLISTTQGKGEYSRENSTGSPGLTWKSLLLKWFPGRPSLLAPFSRHSAPVSSGRCWSDPCVLRCQASAWWLPASGPRQPCSGSTLPSQDVLGGTEPAGRGTAGAGDPTNMGKQSKVRGSPSLLFKLQADPLSLQGVCETAAAGGGCPDGVFSMSGGESTLPGAGQLSPQTLSKPSWAPTYGCAKTALGHCSSAKQLQKEPWSVQGS